MLHLIPISNGQLVSVYWKKIVIPTILSLTVLLLSIGDCWAQGTLRDGGTYTIRNIQNEKVRKHVISAEKISFLGEKMPCVSVTETNSK